jgi:hypothetical protein
MSRNKEIVVIPEIDQLGELNEKLSNEEIKNTLKEIESIAKIIEVGQQTSYQNKLFVLNPVEFPEGTSGKSRQAIFEAAVRVDVLKGHLFEHKKINGEMKIIEAKLMRSKSKLSKAKDYLCQTGDTSYEADMVEAEGEIIIAEAEYRQKELSLEAIESKANQVLRQINDFYEEFNINEELCKKRGFDYSNWNQMEVENDYWNTVNDRKIQKAAAYSMLGMGQQLGDSLPLQNNLDPNRIEFVKRKTIENVKAITESATKPQETPKEIESEEEIWMVKIPNENEIWNSGIEGKNCFFNRDGFCNYRDPFRGKCSKAYCLSIGLTK